MTAIGKQLLESGRVKLGKDSSAVGVTQDFVKGTGLDLSGAARLDFSKAPGLRATPWQILAAFNNAQPGAKQIHDAGDFDPNSLRVPTQDELNDFLTKDGGAICEKALKGIREFKRSFSEYEGKAGPKAELLTGRTQNEAHIPGKVGGLYVEKEVKPEVGTRRHPEHESEQEEVGELKQTERPAKKEPAENQDAASVKEELEGRIDRLSETEAKDVLAELEREPGEFPKHELSKALGETDESAYEKFGERLDRAEAATAKRASEKAGKLEPAVADLVVHAFNTSWGEDDREHETALKRVVDGKGAPNQKLQKLTEIGWADDVRELSDLMAKSPKELLKESVNPEELSDEVKTHVLKQNGVATEEEASHRLDESMKTLIDNLPDDAAATQLAKQLSEAVPQMRAELAKKIDSLDPAEAKIALKYVESSMSHDASTEEGARDKPVIAVMDGPGTDKDKLQRIAQLDDGARLSLVSDATVGSAKQRLTESLQSDWTAPHPAVAARVLEERNVKLDGGDHNAQLLEHANSLTEEGAKKLAGQLDKASAGLSNTELGRMQKELKMKAAKLDEGQAAAIIDRFVVPPEPSQGESYKRKLGLIVEDGATPHRKLGWLIDAADSGELKQIEELMNAPKEEAAPEGEKVVENRSEGTAQGSADEPPAELKGLDELSRKSLYQMFPIGEGDNGWTARETENTVALATGLSLKELKQEIGGAKYEKVMSRWDGFLKERMALREELEKLGEKSQLTEAEEARVIELKNERKVDEPILPEDFLKFLDAELDSTQKAKLRSVDTDQQRAARLNKLYQVAPETDRRLLKETMGRAKQVPGLLVQLDSLNEKQLAELRLTLPNQGVMLSDLKNGGSKAELMEMLRNGENVGALSSAINSYRVQSKGDKVTAGEKDHDAASQTGAGEKVVPQPPLKAQEGTASVAKAPEFYDISMEDKLRGNPTTSPEPLRVKPEALDGITQLFNDQSATVAQLVSHPVLAAWEQRRSSLGDADNLAFIKSLADAIQARSEGKAGVKWTPETRARIERNLNRANEYMFARHFEADYRNDVQRDRANFLERQRRRDKHLHIPLGDVLDVWDTAGSMRWSDDRADEERDKAEKLGKMKLD